MNETLKVMEPEEVVGILIKRKWYLAEDIEAIVKAGTYAPTGRGKQSPIIIAVTNKELRDQIATENAKIMGTDMDPFYGAPVILIVLADKTIPTYKYDGSLVMGNLMNAAEVLVLEVFGFTEQRKNLNLILEKRFSRIWELMVIMKESDIVQSGMLPYRHQHLPQKRKLCILCKIEKPTINLCHLNGIGTGGNMNRTQEVELTNMCFIYDETGFLLKRKKEQSIPMD